MNNPYHFPIVFPLSVFFAGSSKIICNLITKRTYIVLYVKETFYVYRETAFQIKYEYEHSVQRHSRPIHVSWDP